MNKKGFTLIEAIIVIAILGVIGALLAPAIMKAIPNSYFHMFRKAYTTFSQVCTELANDTVMYPDGDLSKDPCRDSEGNSTLSDGAECPCHDFNECFRSKVNTVSGDEEEGYFTTDDGISWRDGALGWNEAAPAGVCDNYNNVGPQIEAKANTVMVDLNGEDNGPNACGYDRFWFGVCRNGRVFISKSCSEGGESMSGEETYKKATEYLNRLRQQVE